MEGSLTFFLALFSLLLISTGCFFLAKRLRIQYTILLVLVGLVLIPLSEIPIFSFLRHFPLTPELLFYIFLPILIFESAYNTNIYRVVRNIRSISLLAVVSLIVSALFIAFALTIVSHWVGFPIPFIVALLFGSLISATDPVAVLALFKEYGVPRRLSLIFEGESLFNDGTSLALFLVVLEIALHGFEGADSVIEGVFMFTTMVVGGIIFGLLMGGIFSKLLQLTKRSEEVQMTLTMLVAHLTFIFSDLISEYVVVFGWEIKISPIIATTLAAMTIGNYGRYKMAPHVEEYMEKFWGYFAFVANSLVFILMGLIFATLPFTLKIFTSIIVLLVILIVIIGRALSIYPVVWLFNLTKQEEPIPRSWQHLLAWGSLRGALAVIMVLLIPDTLTHPAWQHPFTIKEFILAVTIACIYFTLFVKAPTITPLIRKLRLDSLKPIEEVEYYEAKRLLYTKTLIKLTDYHGKGYIDDDVYHKLKESYRLLLKSTSDHEHALIKDKSGIAGRVISLYALGIEKRTAKTLFTYDEISERVYKTIVTRLSVQQSIVQRGEEKMPSFENIQSRDFFGVFDILFAPSALFSRQHRDHAVLEEYMYHRAVMIMAKKVIKEFSKHEFREAMQLLESEASFEEIFELYQALEKSASGKLMALSKKHHTIIEPLNEQFARKGLKKEQKKLLTQLSNREMITARLSVRLQEEMDS